jgi:hypothetical protein
MNRPGFSGGSNFQVEWSLDKQDDETNSALRFGPGRCGWCWTTRGTPVPVGGGNVDRREDRMLDPYLDGLGEEGGC